METSPYLGFKELFTHVVGDMAKAVAERPGETKQQQIMRTQVAAQMIMGLMPRDVIEAMLAGQSVMLHAVITDSIHGTLMGEADPQRRATRANLVALNRSFHLNLTQLRHYQTRPSQGVREATGEVRPAASDPKKPAEAAVSPRSPDPVVSLRSPDPAAAAQSSDPAFFARSSDPAGVPPLPEAAISTPPSDPAVLTPSQNSAIFTPSAEQIAACKASPEAMAALESGDAFRFARAMGIEQPSEAYLAAAAGLQAQPPEPPDHRPLNRHERRHPW